jgi:phosphatidate phosphatase APP1
MSFIGSIRAYAPRVTRLIGSAVAGNNKDRRALRISVTVMIILVAVSVATLSADGSLFAAGVGTTSSVGIHSSVSVSAVPPTVMQGRSLTLIAQITHSFPKARITVIITVTGPAHSGILGSKTVTITTNRDGNGVTQLVYPFKPPFTGTASTSAQGTYHVTAIFVLVYPIATAHATFTVIRRFR